MKGKIPYLDAWENKGPLLFYINALGIFIGNGSRWGVWLMEFLFLFAGIVLAPNLDMVLNFIEQNYVLVGYIA